MERSSAVDSPQECSSTESDSVRLPLTRLLRRSFLKTALIPLVAVEVVLVMAFLVSHQVSTSTQVSLQRADAQENLERLVQARGKVIAQELETVEIATRLFQRQTAAALATPAKPSQQERDRYRKTPEGALVTQDDNGGAAAYYSNRTPLGPRQWQLVWRTSRLDPLMRDLVQTSPLVTQVYFNSFDSYNRIYPYRDVTQQYQPDMEIPTYSFYYRADAEHNPGHDSVWTAAYLDPAGQGWMVSCVAPVYQDDFLVGVVGSDVTLSVLIDQVLTKQVPWQGYAMLIAKDGTILALPTQAEAQWGLREKTSHSYTEFIREDTFKPEEFNLFRRSDVADLSQAMQAEQSDVAQIQLDQRRQLAAWSHIPGTDWIYAMIVPEQAVLARTQALGERLLLLGKSIIAGMVLFYGLFLAYLIRSSRRASQQVAQPLEQIEGLVDAIATGNYTPSPPQFTITELSHTANRVLDMGRTLGERTAALTAALQVKSRFLAVTSHELRTPLNGILGMGELLSQGPLTDQQKDYLEAMMGSGENLLRLLNDILDMSRLEARAIVLDPAPLNLRQLIDTQMTFWRSQMEPDLALQCQVDADLPEQIVADQERLRQMLNNYLSNAIKFTDTGSILLKVSYQPLPSPNSQTPQPGIRFAVRDSGIGIDPVNLKQLFQPFCQIDASRQRSYSGTGLGLSIVKELAILMGGDVGVESHQNQGSTFWFDIPLQSIPAPLHIAQVTPAARVPSEEHPLNLHILLAEDNRINQRLAVSCLQRLGITCDVATNGKEAVHYYPQTNYDLVLMDIHMPEMDGITALHAIRAQDAQAIVVAITADAFPETRELLLQEGFNDYLAKPYRLQNIKDLLIKMTSGQSV